MSKNDAKVEEMQEIQKNRAATGINLQYRHARYRPISMLCIGLILLVECACGSPSRVAVATPTPRVKPTVIQTRGTLATPSPVSSPVSWHKETSPNWSGYSFPEGGITGVRAQWTEPDISRLADGFVATWIGIGGWGESYDNIVQIGTLAYTDSRGKIQHVVWYETLPPNHWIWVGSISAGDSISASIKRENKSVETWDLSLVDMKTGQTFPVTVAFQSLHIYADFIVEDPDATSNNGPPYDPFPRFQPVTFHSADVRYSQGWIPIGAVPGMQITLVQSGRVLARPGPLEGDTFTVSSISS